MVKNKKIKAKNLIINTLAISVAIGVSLSIIAYERYANKKKNK